MLFSPLRYPGGKAKLYPFFVELIKKNGLIGINYCEPYAGGAGLAIRLLINGFVNSVSINDIDASIYAFWMSALRDTDNFCALIEKTAINVDEWHRQKKIWESGGDGDLLALGFSAFFLNRTNRSGIIEGAGPIGGYAQSGAWKIDVRLDKRKQIENIKALARFSEQIEISNLDALKFFRASIRKNSLIYLDPPYFVKGRKLYKNFYKPDDHEQIAQEMKKRRSAKWVVSYDDVPQIRDLYASFAPLAYFPNYSAGEKVVGREVIFLSDALNAPDLRGFEVAA